MAVAWSKHTIFFGGLRNDSFANLLADFDAAVVSVGWVNAGAITGGNEYRLTSPQGMSCRLRIWDVGDHDGSGRHFCHLQMTSDDGTVLGYNHGLYHGVSAYEPSYQAVIGRCQILLALPDHAEDLVIAGARGYTFAAGIPFVPPENLSADCEASAGIDATSDIFWSCSLDSTTGFDFRNSRYCTFSFSHYRNGVVKLGSSFSADAYNGPLCYFPLCGSDNVDRGDHIPPQALKYSSGTPFDVDALVGWEWHIRGQLWDAFLRSKDETLDSQITTTETDAGANSFMADWIAWNRKVPDDVVDKSGDGTWLATLYLLTRNPFTGGPYNIAY